MKPISKGISFIMLFVVMAFLFISNTVFAATEWNSPDLLNTSGTSDSSQDYYPQIIEDSSGILHVVWQSQHNLGGTAGTDWDIFYASNSGFGWSATRLLNNSFVGDTREDQHIKIMERGNGTLYVVWSSGFIYYSYSNDSGVSWSVPSVLYGSGSNGYPEIIEDSAGTLHCVWQSDDNLGGTVGVDLDIFHATSASGTTWGSAALLNTNAASDTGADELPHVVEDSGGTLHAVWSSLENLGGSTGSSDYDIFCSDNSGTGWSAVKLLNSNGTSDSAYWDWEARIIADSGGTLHVVWYSDEDLGGTAGIDRDIFYSTNSGSGWSSPSLLNANGVTDSEWDLSPQIMEDSSGTLHAVWYSLEDLGGTAGTDSDIFYAIDAGSGWSVPVLLNTTATTDSTASDAWPQIMKDTYGTLHAIWHSTYDLGGTAGSDYDILHAQPISYVSDNFVDIQTALDSVYAPATVIVRDGTYTGTNNKNLDFGGKAITLQSENGASSCIIDCQDSGQGFTFQNGETSSAVVDGFSITNGSERFGGGIYCYSSSPTIANCIITDCDAYDPSLATYGGGIYCEGASPSITNCIIKDNTALQNGYDGTGGGIVCLGSSSSSPVITNCVISGNVADGGGGGGIYVSGTTTPTVTNCTITGNSGSPGAGLCVGTSASVTMTDSMLWGNVSGGIRPEIGLIHGDLTISFTDIKGGFDSIYNDGYGILTWGPGNIASNPLFVDAASDDYHLMQGSPCIDAGDPANDYSNEPAPNGARVNIGAYGNTDEATTSSRLCQFLQEVPSYSGTSAPELARLGIARTIVPGRVRTQVKDSSSDAQVKYVVHTRYFEPISLAVVPDFTLSSAPELACLGRRGSDGANLADVRDALTPRGSTDNDLIRRVWFHAQFIPFDMECVSDFGQTSAPELVVLARRPSDTAIMGAKRDASSRFLLGPRTWFIATFLPLDIEVMSDINGNGVEELVSLQQRTSDNEIISEVRDASTNLLIQRVWFGAAHNPLDVEVVSDFDVSSTAPELAMLGQTAGDILGDGSVEVVVKDSSTDTLISTVSFTNSYSAMDLEMVSDFGGGSTAPELVVLSYDPATHGVVGEVRDASTGMLITTVSFDSNYRPKGIEVLPSFGGTSVPELAVHGVHPIDGSVIGEIKDASTGAAVSACMFDSIDVIP